MIPLIWLVAGAVLLVAELLSGQLVLAMLGAAALAAAGASGLGVPLGPDVAVFAVVAALLVLVARPRLDRRLHAGTGAVTGTEALLGTSAEVVERIDGPTGTSGTVRIGGAVWSARALQDDAVLAAGDPVVVVGITGATAVVTRPAQAHRVQETQE